MAVGLQQIQFGKEASWGTLHVATRKIMGLDATSRYMPQSVNTQKRYLQGTYSPAHRVIQTATGAQLQLNGDFSFEEFLYPLLCGIVGGVTGQVSGAGKLWTFPLPLSGAPTAVESRSIEFTDNIDPYVATGSICAGFTLSGGSGIADLVQFKSLWNCKAVASQAITGALTDDTTVDYLPAQMMQLYINDFGGTMGNTAYTGTLLNWTFNCAFVDLKRRASASIAPAAIQYKIPVITLDVTMEDNATSKAEMAKYLANTGRLVQLKGQGPLIGGSDYKTLTIQMAGDWTQLPSLWNADQDDTIFTMRLTPRYDPGSFAQYSKIIIENNLASVTG